MKEYSIMPKCPDEFDLKGWHYENERKDGLHRHEIFFGSGKRKSSISSGLYVYLTPALHNMSSEGVHFNSDFDLALKRLGQRAAMEYYGWSVDDFRKIFSKNYLEELV